MSKYRVLEEDGKFYPQKRKWFILWENIIKCDARLGEDVYLCTYFKTLVEAYHFINTKKVEDAARALSVRKVHYVN